MLCIHATAKGDLELFGGAKGQVQAVENEIVAIVAATDADGGELHDDVGDKKQGRDTSNDGWEVLDWDTNHKVEAILISLYDGSGREVDVLCRRIAREEGGDGQDDDWRHLVLVVVSFCDELVSVDL